MTTDDKRSGDSHPGAASAVGRWAQAIVRALEARGLDGRGLAKRAGIDVRRLADPDVRYPITATATLWRLVVQTTGDPCIGLYVARFVNLTTFQSLGSAVLASSTLRDAFTRFARYGRLISDAANVHLEEDRAGVRLVLEVPRGIAQPADEALDAIFALAMRTARLLRDDRMLSPLLVELQRAEPSPSEPFRRLFRAPVRFAAARNALTFATRDVDAPLPAGNAELARRIDEVLGRSLARVDGERIASLVRATIVERLPAGEPSQAAVARGLGMSSRTLQRRLDREGASFQRILDETRAELARSYLAAGWSITETAITLGFAETSSFSRAFRRWTGRSPSAYDARSNPH